MGTKNKKVDLEAITKPHKERLIKGARDSVASAYGIIAFEAG